LANFSRRIQTPPHKADDAIFIKVGSKRTRSEDGEIDSFDPTTQKKFKSGNPEEEKQNISTFVEDSSRS